MAIPIIEGIESIIAFYNYIQSVAATQSYASAAIAYQALVEQGVATQAVVEGVINTSEVVGQVVEFQPALTGGTEAGVAVSSVAEGTGGAVTVTSGEAVLTATPLIEILGGILAGLGVGILSYEANKDFWIDISNNLFLNLPGYEPITYDNIEDMSILTLFADGKTYVDADLVQRVNNYLIAQGAFNGTYEVEVDIPREPGDYSFNSPSVTADNLEASYSKLISDYQRYVELLPAKRLIMLRKAFTNAMATLTTAAYQNANYYHIKLQDVSSGDGSSWGHYSVRIYFYNQTLPLNRTISSGEIKQTYTEIPTSNYQTVFAVRGSADGTPDNVTYENGDVLSNLSAGNARVGYDSPNRGIWSFNNNIQIIPNIPELPLLPNAIPSETPDSLPTEMPDWWAHILEIGQIDPATGTVEVPQYLPVSVPATSPVTNPVTTPQPAAQTGTVPATNPKPVADSALPIMTPTTSPYRPPADPTPTPTPTPTIPVIPAIGGQANKLFTVYNPSQANLDSLGATLWTQNIITQIVQMFTNNPMDAIISLHILYATPTTGSNKEIKLGYVPTGVYCPEVTNQYVNVDCGTVRVPELFGDARDYANTDISIYLPMIGFRQLKTEDVMGSVVGVVYRVDVFTGTVLATVTVTKAGVNQVFYTYEGNCAVNLPLTGADKSRQVATAVGAIGAMVTGSPLMALGSATAIAGGSAKAQIQRSGNFTGNAGAMGCKKPYIIVSSDVPYDAVGYNAMYGLPANLTVMLGTCSGYVKVKEVHADAISNATEQEKRDIESQLKQGIIIH